MVMPLWGFRCDSDSWQAPIRDRRAGAPRRACAAPSRFVTSAPVRERIDAVDYKVISTDNHINEPKDLFVERLSADLRDRAPRVLAHPDGGEGWSWDGDLPKITFSIVAAAGPGVAEATRRKLTYDEIRPGNYDPAAHL